jgi:hypothetical protein
VLGVTRARIYQLMEMNEQLIRVRWPAGYGLVHGLARHLEYRWGDPDTARLFDATCQLFFPLKSMDESAQPLEVEANLPETPRMEA